MIAVLPGELKQSFADAVKQPEKVAQVNSLSFDILPPIDILPPSDKLGRAILIVRIKTRGQT